MEKLLECLVGGVFTGGTYALIALGFVLIYKATGVINFATGELMMWGACLCWTLLAPQASGLPILLVFPLTLFLAGLLAALVERVVLRPMIGQPIISAIMITIGLAAILKGLAEFIWMSGLFWKDIFRPPFPFFLPAFGWEATAFPGLPDGFWDVVLQSGYLPSLAPVKDAQFWAITVSASDFWGLILAVIAVIGFMAFFRYSRVGLAMRATATDQLVAQSMGISVGRIFGVSWIMAGMAAAVGGMILGNMNSEISSQMGVYGLMVFPVVILGGFDSIGGAILAGIIIGVVENLSGVYLTKYLGQNIEHVVPFVVLVVILFIRPYGLFGKPIIERV
ncbi:MAG: branched-chain amino acid ABC transporter permease [Proteobacteria bacterium]|nr:branched-chain amino acid ABC transporter permease [Pseudomonadota bacterium]